MSIRFRRLRVAAAVLVLAWPAASAAQTDELPRDAAITAPRAFLGFDIGDDYQLATYEQLVDYWKVLASESDRMVLDTIGETEFGRPHVMGVITSPANHADLDRYRAISRRLALAEDADPAEAARLAREGKAVIWIDGGLHATEVLGAQQLMKLVYDMVSLVDEETLRFLDDVILLTPHANPDGHALVAGWYMREDDPMQRSTSGIPELYEKYAGHDNNRDFYMANLAETQNLNRVAYREWFPQIMYNHHQTGPAGTVMFAPPFRDPPNHNIHPLMLTSLDAVGAAMHGRMVREGKGGTTMRSGASYSTWWNGGLRTTPYFHNMIGLLTETIGNPTPQRIPFIPDRQLTHSDLPLPVEPGMWHFKQSIDYSQTANRAVLDYASRNKELLLENIWRMGRDAIEAGSADSWDNTPREIYAAREALRSQAEGAGSGRFGGGARATEAEYHEMLRAPEDRQARGYVIPSDQADFNTAMKFVNTLLMNGVRVERATAPFAVQGTSYPAGSLVVKTDQAFAPHVFDQFEPQDHPDDFAYPGGPPIPPYDLTGWTLAYQMNVEFDRYQDGFEGPFESVTAWNLEPEPGVVRVSGDPAGYLLDHRVNDAFRAVNRVLAQGGSAHSLSEPVAAGGIELPAGAFYVSEISRAAMETIARETGVDALGVGSRPQGEAVELRPVRIGLWDRYGGSMPSGWLRLVLEDFEFDFEVVYPPELDAGGLASRYDVLIFPDGAVSEGGRGFRGGGGEPDVPEEYRDRVGSVTAETTVPQIAEFMQAGGATVAIGGSTSLASMLGLPVGDHLVDADGERLGQTDFFVPGSLLEVTLDTSSPLTRGMGSTTDVMFARSPVLSVPSGAAGLRVIGRYEGERTLRSGWAWGQEHLDGGAAFIEADVGSGKLFLFAPEITFRGQSHGNFPLLFNAIMYGGARSVRNITEMQP